MYLILPCSFQTPLTSELPAGHVLVKVQATALNPAGYKLMSVAPNFLAGRPHIVELDMAGIVVDAKGTEFSVGDKVFGSSSSTRKGTLQLAEYLVFPAASLALVPLNVSAIEASGLGVVVAVAYQSLVEMLKIEAGQTVFINGGSSGIGLAAIQIAKSMGCTVVATAIGKKKKLLSLGVDEFLDYTQAPLVEQLLSKPRSPKFHAIFDAVGFCDPGLYLNCASYLAPGGAYVTAGNLPKTRREITGMLRQKHMEAVWDLVASAVKPIVDSVYSFDQDGVMKAYEKVMSNRAVGKVVIKVVDEE
ncbi:hypothetical protein C8R43DRAFT_1088689 [Mycena crocata]|nr:hypothetical protein C8R43DRAFT_1088689 [Mycena crocata]